MQYTLISNNIDVYGNPLAVNSYDEYTDVPQLCPNCRVRQEKSDINKNSYNHLCKSCGTVIVLEGYHTHSA